MRDHNTAFPIYWRKTKFDKEAQRQTAGVSDAVRALIERSQPYHWGERANQHPLAILKQLSNRDKHRTLLPVALARRNEHFVGFGEWKIAKFTYMATGPIGDGEEVMRFLTVGEPAGGESVTPYLSFEVQIEGRTLHDFESVFEFIDFKILDAFDRS